MRLMVVDDSRATRHFLRQHLVSQGHAVVEAGDGQEALNALRKDSDFDLVLLDWYMPELDGLSFLKLLRSDEELQWLKVMMVTSEGDPEILAQAKETGADAFLLKPFTVETLDAAIAGVLSPSDGAA